MGARRLQNIQVRTVVNIPRVGLLPGHPQCRNNRISAIAHPCRPGTVGYITNRPFIYHVRQRWCTPRPSTLGPSLIAHHGTHPMPATMCLLHNMAPRIARRSNNHNIHRFTSLCVLCIKFRRFTGDDDFSDSPQLPQRRKLGRPCRALPRQAAVPWHAWPRLRANGPGCRASGLGAHHVL